MITNPNFVILVFRNIKTEFEKIVYIHFDSTIYSEGKGYKRRKIYQPYQSRIFLLKIIIRQEISFDAP